jgi:hypothetical protein
MLRTIVVGLCMAALAGCGQGTPKRGPAKIDRKKHPNGQFASKTEYYMDDTGKAVKHGKEARYYENGNYHVRGYNKDGKSHGRWDEFFADGSYKGVVNFTDGNTDGKIAMWHPNGQFKLTGESKNGLQIGEWLHYNDQGQIVKKQVYKKGELKTEESFTPARLDPKDVPKPALLKKDGIVLNKAIPDPKPPVKDGSKGGAGKSGKPVEGDAKGAAPVDTSADDAKGEAEPKAEK